MTGSEPAPAKGFQGDFSNLKKWNSGNTAVGIIYWKNHGCPTTQEPLGIVLSDLDTAAATAKGTIPEGNRFNRLAGPRPGHFNKP
jgi:hypothetical protein